MAEFVIRIIDRQAIVEPFRGDLFSSPRHCVERLQDPPRQSVSPQPSDCERQRHAEQHHRKHFTEAAPEWFLTQGQANENRPITHGVPPAGEPHACSVPKLSGTLRIAIDSLPWINCAAQQFGLVKDRDIPERQARPDVTRPQYHGASSRSTKPTPRTVCNSFFAKGSSTFRRSRAI